MSQPFFNPKKIDTNFIAEAVQKQYGISSSKLPELMSGSVVNAAWQIDSAEQQYVVKVFVSDKEGLLAEIQRELDLLTYLRSCNLAVSEVIAASNKNSITEITYQDIVCPMLLMKLEKLVRVYPDDIGDKQLTKLGESLALLHLKSQSYPNLDKLPQWRYQPIFATLPSLLDTPNEKGFSRVELENIQELDKKIVNLPYKLPESLTMSLLHGDFGTEHAQFLPNDSVYIFDFGDASYGPVIVDLAIFFSHLYGEMDVKGLNEWKEMTKKVLEGYEQVIKLSDEEKQVISMLIAKRLTSAIIYLNKHSKKSGEQVDVIGTKKRYQLLGYLVDSFK